MKQRKPSTIQPKATARPQPLSAAAQENMAKLRTALIMHQQGLLDQAEVIYKEILQSQPQHFDALQLLAMAAAQRKNSAAALELFDQALKINPHHASLLNNRGNTLRDLKRYAEALENIERALKIKPDHIEALCNRGLILQDLQRPQEALASYERALKVKPDYAIAHFNRGNALQNLERYEAALESYDHALAIQPNDAEAHCNRGVTLLSLKRPQEALESYDHALSIRPDYAEAFNYRGNALQDLKRYQEALQSYDRALAIQPDYAEALYNRSSALRRLKRFEEALQSCDLALKIKPDYAESYNNRGNALQDLKRHEEALESYNHALKLKPDYAEAFYNRSSTLQDLNLHQDALESYACALKLKPNYAEARWNESLCRLLLGDYAQGWPGYEWRWKVEPGINEAKRFTQPLWLGKENIENKTIFVHWEQGLGDTIQFCRYAKQVAALGAKVILEVQAPLIPLLRNWGNEMTILEAGESPPDFDYQCPLLSLPLAFQTHLGNITSSSYLQSDRQKVEEWKTKLGESGKKKIGLVWSGSTAHKDDYDRSILLEQFKTLVDDQADYYGLQKELRPADKIVLEHTQEIKFLGNELNDFSDTAAVIDLMDLVITVDTSVAHLAGAMGKEVWVLLLFNPDWRWLLNRDDSPWYHSAKLFRQPAIGDWASVLTQVKAEVKAQVKAGLIKKIHGPT